MMVRGGETARRQSRVHGVTTRRGAGRVAAAGRVEEAGDLRLD